MSLSIILLRVYSLPIESKKNMSLSAIDRVGSRKDQYEEAETIEHRQFDVDVEDGPSESNDARATDSRKGSDEDAPDQGQEKQDVEIVDWDGPNDPENRASRISLAREHADGAHSI